jgi:hypothetical protein
LIILDPFTERVSRRIHGFSIFTVAAVVHTRPMKALRAMLLGLLLHSAVTWAAAPAPVHLRPGDRITLHVGQVAILKLSSAHPYTVTLEGEAVTPMQSQAGGRRVYSYRAVHAGTATLLIEPSDSKPGDCIDCETRHCFLTVRADR